MTAAMAMPGNTAATFLVHFFGTGLADDRYVVERFRALANGEIRPVASEAAAAKGRRKTKHTVVSRIRCGHVPPMEGRALCEPCREDRRQAKRARHAERRAAGLCVTCAAPAPGGKAYCEPCAGTRSKRRNLKAKRAADRRRYAERRARGECTSCGKPADGAAECRACCAAARARYDARRAAGVCVRCKTPTFGGTAYCAPCAVAKAERRDREAEYAARRQRYAERRAKGRCVLCNAPAPGAARCAPCSRKHRESSGAFRGIPVWDPTWTVIEIASGREHGPFDSAAEVALCLAFEKLAPDQVEVLCDASLMSTITAPPW
ncbi:MAG: hypothetical protein OXH87_08160 [Rhodospirillaceae bacterium]|nr:hypothetical protein [Rhodospirillaceae bacterium]